MRRFQNTLRQILVLFLISQMCTFTLPARGADVVVDPSIPAVNGTAIDTAQNGVTVINLAATSAGGVSHNRFTEYNVGPSGIILNNSREMGISVLGGALYGNPNYQGGIEASIVLNEVTGTNRSNLLGYTEMFGRSAEFILVNPNGIMCNGAGFINMPKVTLSTGTAVMDNGYFRGINVKDGTFSVEGAGIDARGVSYFEIITRMASLNGAIWGNDVNIKTGTGFYNYQSGKFEGGSGDGIKPEYAIDASALGSIYAGRISIISNESGVGVRSQGDMLADVSDISISADGSISLKNTQAAKNINAASANGNIRQEGDVFALGSINYSAAEVINRGSVKSVGDFTLAGIFDNAGGSVLSSGNIDINTGGILNNTGGKIIVNSDTAAINIHGNDSLAINGGDLKSAGGININMTGDVNLLNAGTVYADKYFTLKGAGLTTGKNMSMNGSIDINVSGDVNNGAGNVISSNSSLKLFYGGKLTNSGTISGSSININGGSLENTATGVISGGYGNSVIDIAGNIDNYNRISSASGLAVKGGIIRNHDAMSMIAAGGNLTLAGTELINDSGLLFSGNSMNIKAHKIENNTGLIISMADMIITGDGTPGSSLVNKSDSGHSARIESAGNMTINMGMDGSLTNTGFDSGGYTYGPGQTPPPAFEDFIPDGYNLVGMPGYCFWNPMFQIDLISDMKTVPSYITSGSNLTITAGNVLNHGSVIAANDDITINANTFINETNNITLEILLYQLWGYRDKGMNNTYTQWVPGNATLYSEGKATVTAGGTITINAVTKVDNGLTGTSGMALTGGMGNIAYNTSTMEDLKTTGAIDISAYVKVDENGTALFRINKESGTRYLIETRLEYIDVSKLKGSKYLLDRIGFNPDKDVKFLGDAYYEQVVVMEAIYRATSERFLDESINDAQEQMAWLLDNAATAYSDLKLAVGVELTKEQINELQQPIIWYVEETVMGVNVLSPKIYIPEHIIAGFTKGGDSMIAADKVIIHTEGELTNTGLIKGDSSVEIAAGEIKNITIGDTAEISGGEVDLTAKNDIINRGGTIKSEGDLSIKAIEGSVINETAVNTIIRSLGNVESRLGTTAEISSGGNLDIQAGGNVSVRGAVVKSDGDAAITAGGNIDFETVKLWNMASVQGKNFSAVTESTTSAGSTLGVGGNLVLKSGRDINFIGSRADVAGDADVKTGGNFNLINDYNTFSYESRDTKKGKFSSSTTNTEMSTNTVVSSAFNTGGNLKIDSENDINIVGSDMASGGDADVKAAGNVNIVAVHDETYISVETKKSGFGVGGSVFGTVKQSDTMRDRYVNDSTVGIKGNYASTSGGDTNIIGSKVNVGGTADMKTGGDLNIVAAYNEHSEDHKTEKSGFFTGYNKPFSHEVEAVGQRSRTVGAPSENELQGGLKAIDYISPYSDIVYPSGASVINARSLKVNSGDDIFIEGSIVNAESAEFKSAGSFIETSAREERDSYSVHEEKSFSFNIAELLGLTTLIGEKPYTYEKGRFSTNTTLGEFDKKETTINRITQSSSEINVNGNLVILSDEDLTIAGSDINAGGDITLAAKGDVRIETTEESVSKSTENIDGTYSLSVSVENEFVNVYYFEQALEEATKKCAQAKDDYDVYREGLQKAREDLVKGLITKSELDSIEDDEKYYKVAIALAEAEVAAKTCALVQQVATAIGSARTYGFTGDVRSNIDAIKEVIKSRETTSKGSNIQAGGNLVIKSNDTAGITGSTILASGNIDIEAKDVEIIAAVNSSNTSTDKKHINNSGEASYSRGFSVDVNGDTTDSESDSIWFTNSHIDGANITIKSSRDTAVIGGVVTAEGILSVTAGGDLTVASLQDTESGKSETYGAGGGITYNGSWSGRVSANFNRSSSDSEWVTEQTSLTGGTVKIDVEDKTTLAGAVIASTIDDLAFTTGSFSYNDIKDHDKTKNFGGGAEIKFSEGKDGKCEYDPGLTGATFGFTDKKQTNFATIGAGTITVEDNETDLTKLNRDVTVSQYLTQDTGVQLEASKEILQPIDTVKATVKAAIEIFVTVKEIAQKASNWLKGKGYKTDEEVKKDEEAAAAKKAEEERLKKEQEEAEKAEAERKRKEKEAADKAAEAAAKRGTPTEDTKKIMDATKWNGDDIENKKNPDVINQFSDSELAAAKLPINHSGCMFFSTAYGAADAMGITLSPEDVKKVYEYALNQEPPSIGTDKDGNPSAYWVRSFSGIKDAVAAVKNVDASNISIPDALKSCTSSDSQNVTQEIIKALNSGGSAEIRYAKDPTRPDSVAHSMRVTGSFIENGNVILSLIDTAAPNTKTFVDTRTMKLYTEDDDHVKKPSKRPVSSYLPIKKNNNVSASN